jgi:hypothetical protein
MASKEKMRELFKLKQREREKAAAAAGPGRKLTCVRPCCCGAQCLQGPVSIPRSPFDLACVRTAMDGRRTETLVG